MNYKLVLFTILAIIAGFIFTAQKASAQIYYGGENKCIETSAVNCPFGLEEQDESDLVQEIESVIGVDGKNLACVPKASKFCTLVTGSPQVAHNDSGEQYCTAKPLASVGRCNRSSKISEANALEWGTTAWRFDYNRSSGAGAEIYQNLQQIFGNRSYYPNRNFKGRDLPLNINLDPTDSHATYREIGCIDIKDDDNNDLYVWIPRVNEGLKADSNERPYTTTENITNLYRASQFGLVVSRGDDSPRFCADPNAVYARPEGADDDEGVCYSGIGGRPCMINNVSGGGGTNYCVIGVDPAARVAGNFTPIFRHYGYSKGSTAPDSFHLLREASNNNFCKRNSKDMLENSTSKGCSDYLEVRDSDNGLQYKGTKDIGEARASGASSDEIKRLNNISEDNKRRYQECLKCLYGSDGKFNNNSSNPDEYNVRTGDFIATFASGVAVTRPPTGAITPDNEYLAKPLQGRFFNDLRCVNASDPTNIINTILRCALGIMALLVVLRFMQGTLLMQQTQGFDPEKVQEGRDIIISALVAMLVLILSGAILNFLGVNVLNLGDQGFLPFG